MAGEALHHQEDPNQGLDTHQDSTDEILSRLDDAALKDLAENGELEDVRAVVMSLVADNPSLEPYLIDFQQQNDTALVAQLRREAANELAQPDTEHGDQANPEESEMEENIEAAKKYLYESLEIDENHENNGALTNFAKGIVDTLIFENAELAAQVIETKGQVILDALQNLATWSGIKQVLSALGESIWDLWDGDAYEKGKAVADLGLVATGVGLTAAVGRKVVKSAVRNLETPSAHNLDRALTEDIAKLPPAERLEAAGVFLGREIPENQRQAILDAHNYGERLPDGSYSLSDLREKTRILREAGFTSGEIRTLFDNNICGKEVLKFPDIYTNPQFSYLNEYRDILGENFTYEDIISNKGTQAIILRHPTDAGQVIKIAKPGEVDDLKVEFGNHQKFYAAWKKGIKEGKIPENIKIPSVKKGDRDGYFYMDRVEGQSLYGVVLREKYASILINEDPEFLKTLSDTQLENLLVDEYAQYKPSVEMTIEDWSGEYLGELLGYSHSYRKETGKMGGTPLDITRAYLKGEGLKHTDLHPGNIMLDKNGNIYIIDFGRVQIIEKP